MENYRNYQIKYHKEHYQKNKQKYRDRAKLWRKNNPEKRKQIARDSARKIRSIAIEILGSKCSLCEEPDIRALEIHHINGRPKNESNSITHKLVITSLHPELEYQLLCGSCHNIKTWEEKFGKTSTMAEKEGMA